MSNDNDFKSFHDQFQFRSNGLVFRIVLVPHEPGHEEHEKSEWRTTVLLIEVLFIYF